MIFRTETKRRKIGLALGSGGARGLAHLGILARLIEWQVPISCVAGTSIGAIMGAIYASGKVKEALEWALALDWMTAAKLFAEVNVPTTGFLRGKRIEERLRTFIPGKTYADLQLPFATVATDIMTGEEVVIRDGDLMEGVRASYAIPGVFMPIEREGRQLVDGGLVNPLPISICRSLGADCILAVDVNIGKGPEGYRSAKKTLKIFDILTNSIKIFENEMSRNTIAAQAPDLCLQPPVGDIFTLDFRTVKTGIEAGFATADAMKEQILAVAEEA